MPLILNLKEEKGEREGFPDDVITYVYLYIY